MRPQLGGDQPGARTPRPGPPAAGPCRRARAHRSSQRLSRPATGTLGQGDGGELAGLILRAGPGLGDGRDPGRVAVAEVGAELRPPGRAGAPLGQLAHLGQSRHGTQRDAGPLIVRDENGLGLGQQRCGAPIPARPRRKLARAAGAARAPAGGLAQRVAHRGDDPARMAVPDGQVPDPVVGPARRGDLQPGVEVAGRHLAQDGVDETRRPRADDVPHQVDRGGHGRVRGHPRREQLVRAEPEDLAHGEVEGVQVAVAADGEHRVVGALAAQRAVGQLRGQRRVPARQATLGQRRREEQVGVGIPLRYRAEHVTGGPPDRVGPALTLGAPAATRPGPRPGAGAARNLRGGPPSGRRPASGAPPGRGCGSRHLAQHRPAAGQPEAAYPFRGRHQPLAAGLNITQLNGRGGRADQDVRRARRAARRGRASRPPLPRASSPAEA